MVISHSFPSQEDSYHLSLSFAPAEKVELFNTSPISSLQKLKLLMVQIYENFTTFTCKLINKSASSILSKYQTCILEWHVCYPLIVSEISHLSSSCWVRHTSLNHRPKWPTEIHRQMFTTALSLSGATLYIPLLIKSIGEVIPIVSVG